MEDIRKNIAFSSPESIFNYFVHSTYSNLDNSFNFGYIDGKYQEWDDCQSYAYWGKIECEGIGLIPEYRETDEWGCTRTILNGKGFWLNTLHQGDNYIIFNEAVNGSHNSDGFVEKIVRAVGNKTVTVTDTDFCTGEEFICIYYYNTDTEELIKKEYI